MPRPYVPTNKKTLYGTQAKPERVEPECRPISRNCAICGAAKPDEWYELMREGWVCDPCRPRANHIQRETQIENHRS